MNIPSCCVDVKEEPMCCDLSPGAQLLATGLVNGRLLLHSYAVAAPGSEGGSGGSTGGKGDGSAGSRLSHRVVHDVAASSVDHSCRAVAFVQGGANIAAGWSDHSVATFDAQTGKLVRRLEAAHGDEVSSLFCPRGGGGAAASGQLLASGDEAGGVKVWDMRTEKAVYSYKKHKDYISGFGLQQKDSCLLAVSGDGTLSAHDLRANKFRLRTEDDADDELLSVCVVKGGKKVVVGTQSGVLNLYSWGAMADCSDRFPGHPESVDALFAFDDDTIITGSSDGVVRIVGVLPNRLLGVLGQHGDLPIESLSLSADRRVLASASHDHTVRLWDLSELVDGASDGEDEDVDVEEDGEGGGGGGGGGAVAAVGARAARVAASDGDNGSNGGSNGGEEKGESEEGDGESDDASSSDSDGNGDGDGSTDRQGSLPGAPSQPSAGGKRSAQQAAKSGGKGEEGDSGGDGTGSGSDDSNDSDDSDAGKRKRAKPDKTKWRKGAGGAKSGGANFFADLL